MVNAELLRKRLARLEEYLSILSHISRYSFEEFIADPERYGAAERFLQLSIESINDLGNHIISDLKLGEVNWQSDIPQLLAKNGYLSQEIQQLWIKMIGFRNVLVHEYMDVDRRLVYEVLQNNLGEFRAIIAVLSSWLS
jgi:uncharacterized protein YutE (UPF0331/DUF86 family)